MEMYNNLKYNKNLVKNNRKRFLQFFVLLMFIVSAVFFLLHISNSAFALDQSGNDSSPNLLKTANSNIYNLTIGSSVVGIDSSKWSGEGDDLHYSITTPISADFYPSINTLKLYGGDMSGYFQYTKEHDGVKYNYETSGVLSVNNIDLKSDFGLQYNPIELDYINVEVCQDTNLVINNHDYSSDTSVLNNDYFHHIGISTMFVNNDNTPCNMYLYGNNTLTISANVNKERVDIVDGIRSNELYFGKDSNNTIAGLNLMSDSFNINCSSENTCANCCFVDAMEIQLFSTTFILENCDIFSYTEAYFNGLMSDGGIYVDSNSLVNIKNINLTGMTGIDMDSPVRINGLKSRGSKGIENHGSILLASQPGESFNIDYQGNEKEGESGYAEINGILIDNTGNGSCVSDGKLDFGTFNVDYSSITDADSRIWLTGITVDFYNCNIDLSGGDFSFNKNGRSYINYSCDTHCGKNIMSRALSCVYGDITLENVNFNSLDPVITDFNSNCVISVIDICPQSYCDIENSDLCLGKNVISTLKENQPKNNTFFGLMQGCSIANSKVCLKDLYGSQKVSGFECGGQVVLGSNSILDVSLLPGSNIVIDPNSGNATNDDSKIVVDDGVEPYIYYSSDYQNIDSSTTLDEKCYGEGVCFFRIFDNANAFNLSFDTNGGSSIISQRVFNGYYAIKPSDPVKQDYTFDNWYKEANYQSIWDFATDVATADTVLYAKWNGQVTPEPPAPVPGDEESGDSTINNSTDSPLYVDSISSIANTSDNLIAVVFALIVLFSFSSVMLAYKMRKKFN